MFENFTNRAKNVVKLAKKEAQLFNHSYIGTEHILLALIKLGQGIAVHILKNWDVSYEDVHNFIDMRVGYGPELHMYSEPVLSSEVKEFFHRAEEEASQLGHNYVGIEHLLLALLTENDSCVYRIFREKNFDIKALRREILKELETFNLQTSSSMSLFSSHSESYFPFGEEDKEKGGRGESASCLDQKSAQTPSLNTYGRDLTQKAREGSLDPVIGREKEIDRLILILCRRRKNNPILVGESGVGKTAIVEGLAQLIVTGNVSENLQNKKLISLDLTLMIAGTKYRGQFEERIKSVMEEIQEHGDILLFIDEIHMIVGAGAAEGAIDASNIFKPVLSRGELQCIGATTLDEYRKYIEQDAALTRRFQNISVPPPSTCNAKEILKGLQKKYEEHHQCTYTEGAVAACVDLSERYIHGERHLPDKAIDVMDEAGAEARMRVLGPPEKIRELEKSIEKMIEEKEISIEQQDYEKAASLRDEEKKLRRELEEVKERWKKDKREKRAIIDEEDIAEVIGKQTRIPISRLTETEKSKILQLQETLGAELIGQQEAISAVSRAIQRSYADVKDPNCPLGSFLFLGPTGVGKTLCARLLALHMFGGVDALIQIDMSEYMEKFAVSRLTGSPPGYVGHEEGGQLTERIRRRPYSVVLFDEVEKAHPDVLDLLLQILEEGHLTDSYGRKVDCRHAIIILTSNLGADLISRKGQMGFGSTSSEQIPTYEQIREMIEETIKKNKTFKPEFLNRLDDSVIFNRIDRKGCLLIIDREVKKLKDRLSEKSISLELSVEAKEFLLKKGFQPEMGARPLKRMIQKHLEDKLAEYILKHPKWEGSFTVTSDGNQLTFQERGINEINEVALLPS